MAFQWLQAQNCVQSCCLGLVHILYNPVNCCSQAQTQQLNYYANAQPSIELTLLQVQLERCMTAEQYVFAQHSVSERIKQWTATMDQSGLNHLHKVAAYELRAISNALHICLVFTEASCADIDVRFLDLSVQYLISTSGPGCWPFA